MLMNKEQSANVNEKDLEKLIEKALAKINAKTENELCRYLPGPKGGHIHHFTLKKYKLREPSQYASLVQEFVMNVTTPIKLDPKSRAPRGSRKRKEMVSFTRSEVEKIIDWANRAGDSELLAKFAPRKPLPSIKRDLARSIRHEEIREDLWRSYTDAVKMGRSAKE